MNVLLSYIKKMPMPKEEEIKEREVTIGKQNRHMTLIFDMDETLINSRLYMYEG